MSSGCETCTFFYSGRVVKRRFNGEVRLVDLNLVVRTWRPKPSTCHYRVICFGVLYSEKLLK